MNEVHKYSLKTKRMSILDLRILEVEINTFNAVKSFVLGKTLPVFGSKNVLE